MSADLYDTKEPLLRCLQDSLAAWQSALHRILAQSGISPDEWQLLLQLADEQRPAGEVREANTPVLPWLQQGEMETMLHALSDQGWLERTGGGGTPMPVIRSAARLRVDRLRQAIKALQSAWVAPLSLEERGLMIACLTKMQRQLDRCEPRARPYSSYSDIATGPDDAAYVGYDYPRSLRKRF